MVRPSQERATLALTLAQSSAAGDGTDVGDEGFDYPGIGTNPDTGSEGGDQAGTDVHVITDSSAWGGLIDYATARWWYIVLTDDLTYSLTGAPAAGLVGRLHLIFVQGPGGPWTVTHPAEVLWPDTDGTEGGPPPDLYTAETAGTRIDLTTFDGAVTWDGNAGGSVAALALDDLTDVDTTGVADGDVLTYDSGSGDWIAAAPTGGAGAFIGAKVYHNTTQSATTGVELTLAFNSEDYDSDGFHDNSTNNGRLTIPAGMGGKYLVGGHIQFDTNGTSRRYLRLNHTTSGGTLTAIAGQEFDPNTNDLKQASIAGVMDCAPGDYFTLVGLQQSGGDLNVTSAATHRWAASFWLVKLNSGGSASQGYAPVAMQAGASPVADAYTNASNLAANGGVVVFPIVVPATMTVHSARIRSTDTGTARSWEWRLFTDAGSTTLAQVAGLNGSESFTPSAASTRDANATTATQIPPGTYWLAIRNTHATNTLGVGYATNQTSASVLGTGPAVILNSITGALGSTLDVSSITIFARMYGVALTGRVWGQSVGLFE